MNRRVAPITLVVPDAAARITDGTDRTTGRFARPSDNGQHLMDSEPRTVAEIVEAVHDGSIGHRQAIEALGLRGYNDLIDVMHANGLPLWAHRPPRRASRELLDVLAAACGKKARPAGT